MDPVGSFWSSRWLDAAAVPRLFSGKKNFIWLFHMGAGHKTLIFKIVLLYNLFQHSHLFQHSKYRQKGCLPASFLSVFSAMCCSRFLCDLAQVCFDRPTVMLKISSVFPISSNLLQCRPFLARWNWYWSNGRSCEQAKRNSQLDAATSFVTKPPGKKNCFFFQPFSLFSILV